METVLPVPARSNCGSDRLVDACKKALSSTVLSDGELLQAALTTQTQIRTCYKPLGPPIVCEGCIQSTVLCHYRCSIRLCRQPREVSSAASQSRRGYTKPHVADLEHLGQMTLQQAQADPGRKDFEGLDNHLSKLDMPVSGAYGCVEQVAYRSVSLARKRVGRRCFKLNDLRPEG